MKIIDSKFALEIREVLVKNHYTRKNRFYLPKGTKIYENVSCCKYVEEQKKELISIWPASRNSSADKKTPKVKALRGMVGWWCETYQGGKLIKKEWQTQTITFTDSVLEQGDEDDPNWEYLEEWHTDLKEAKKYVDKFFSQNKKPVTITYNIKKGDLWNFISDNLPNYYQRDDVLYNDIITRYVNNEELDDDDLQKAKEAFPIIENARKWLEEDEKRLFLEAIENAYDNGEIASILMLTRKQFI